MKKRYSRKFQRLMVKGRRNSESLSELAQELTDMRPYLFNGGLNWIYQDDETMVFQKKIQEINSYDTT